MTVQTIVDFNRESYKEICAEMRDIIQIEKEVAAKKEELRKKIIDMAGGDRMENGIKITKRTSKGSTDYKGALQKMYPVGDDFEIICDTYRKPDREFWEVRSY